MNIETTKPTQQARSGSRLSNESFITLFMAGVLVVIFLIACLIIPGFYKPQNIINILTNNWYIVIIGIGVTFLLITGHFDMSVGGVIAMTGVLSVYFCQAANVSQNALANGLGLPYGVAIALALLCAMGIGGINAFFVAKLKVPSIIVTLGTMMLARGIGQVVTQGAQRNTSLPDVFGVIGNATLLGSNLKVSVLIMVVLLIIAFIFERRTVAGRRTYLIGANQEAARLSGIKVTKHIALLLHRQRAVGRHYRDPADFGVQSGSIEPGGGLRVRRAGRGLVGRRQHRGWVWVGARHVRRRHPALGDDDGGYRPAAVTRLAVHTQGCGDLRRHPCAAVGSGSAEPGLTDPDDLKQRR